MKYKQNHEESSKLLTQPKVSQRVKEIKQIAAKVVLKKFDYDIEKLFKKITQWIDAGVSKIINLSPSELKNLPKNVRQLITNFKHTTFEGGTKRLLN